MRGRHTKREREKPVTIPDCSFACHSRPRSDKKAKRVFIDTRVLA
jgi:hypothetical protein